MAFIRIPFSIEVTVVFTIGGKEITNRHYVYKTDETPISAADCVNVSNEVYDAYDQYWMLSAVDDMNMVEVNSRSVNEEEGSFGAATATLPVTGAEVTEALPANVALVATLGTSFSGRSGRGRTYLAGLAEGDVSGNTVVPALATAANATLMAIDENVSPLGFRHRLATKYHNGVLRDPVLTRNINSYITNVRVDTQRRRLPS